MPDKNISIFLKVLYGFFWKLEIISELILWKKKELNMVYTVEFLIMINVIVFCLLEILYKVYVFIIFLSKVLFFFLIGANRMIGLFKYQNFVSGIRKVNCSFVCTCKITLISLQLNTQSLVIRQYKCLNLYTVKW